MTDKKVEEKAVEKVEEKAVSRQEMVIDAYNQIEKLTFSFGLTVKEINDVCATIANKVNSLVINQESK